MATPAGNAGCPLTLRFAEEGRGDPASYVCPRCQKVVLEPVVTQCGRRMCEDCVPLSSLEDSSCPIQGCVSCGKKAPVVPDCAGRRDLREARAYCPHQGCRKQPHLGDWESHVIRCPYGNADRRAWVAGREVEANAGGPAVPPETTEKTDGTRRQRQQQHPRPDGVELHLEFLLASSASLQQENEALKRELRDVRAEACQGHAKLEGQIGGLEQELLRCKAQLGAVGGDHEARLDRLESLDDSDGTLLWKVGPYAQLKADSLSGKVPAIHSPPFRVGRTGYRMRLKACLGGVKEGKGTHLSLYVVLMKGKYDALLSWPFDRTVTMEVLDQSAVQSRATPVLGTAALQQKTLDRPCRHIQRCLLAGDSSLSKGFARPALGLNNLVGYSKFVSHQFLESAGRDFIKDDVMFVKATVDMDGLILP